MTTLTAGASTTVNLAAGQSLLFLPGGSGVAVLSGGQQAGVSYALGASNAVIGPFRTTQGVSISAYSAIEFFILAAEYSGSLPDTPVTARPPEGPGGIYIEGVKIASIPVVSTWANRTNLVAADMLTAFFTDVGIGGGSFWEYRGGRWRPQGGRVVIKNLLTPVSNSAAPKVVMDYATILAGLWQDGDSLEIDALKTREGGTSDTDATDLMIGTVALTPGTTTGLSSSALATTAIQYRMWHEIRRESATSIRTMAIAGGGGGLGTSTSLTTLTTGLTSLDTTEQYLQITSDLTTAGGEVSWLRKFRVTLISGA